jgi:nucleolar protein 15
MAAEDLKTKKRKGMYDLYQLMYTANRKCVGASDAAPKPKKQKKVDEAAPVAPSAKPARKRAADPIDDEEAPAKKDAGQEKKSKKTMKSKTATTDDAADTAAVVVEVKEKPKKKAQKNEEPEIAALVEVVAEAPKAKTKKEKKSKRSDDALAPAVESEALVPEQVTVAVDAKRSKKSKKQEEVPVEKGPEPVEETAPEDEDDLDDQTAALLAGFESDRDESDLEKEDEIIDEDAVPKLSKKQRKALENVRKGSEPGVVYLGFV